MAKLCLSALLMVALLASTSTVFAQKSVNHSQDKKGMLVPPPG